MDEIFERNIYLSLLYLRMVLVKDLLFVGCVWGVRAEEESGSNESNKGDNEWAGAEVINDSGGSD